MPANRVIRCAILATALAGTALPAQQAAEAVRRNSEVSAASCTPPAPPAAAADPEQPPLLVAGLGYAGMDPDTANEEAIAWFKQGVRFIWAFDEVEAVRSFQMAQKIDPSCALCFWGEAWARGPTINLRPRTAELDAARKAAQRASEIAGRLAPRDQLLVKAMLVRTGAKAFENERYAGLMETAALRMPGDDLVSILAADARMVSGPRNALKAGSLTQRLLERVLGRNPEHGGAIHYYIHYSDWIDREDLAVPFADRLGRIAPAASHLVHMPSHSYYGVGRYKDAAAVNVAAIAADNAYTSKVRPPASGYRTGLLGHDMHFAINSALMRGDAETALTTSAMFRKAFPKNVSVISSGTYFADGLHSDPKQDLAAPEQGNTLEKSMRHYARGEALARLNDAEGVGKEAQALAAILDGPQAATLGSKFAESFVTVLRHVLEGRAAMLAGQPEKAAEAYFKGMQRQITAGFSSDPPVFWYPVRRSYAAALIAAGDHKRAREHLLVSLSRWPNDPLALLALSQAERALGENGSADRNLARAKSVWAGDIGQVPLSRI
jgi:tetratricopeptide (TPR) repeat protein